MGDSNDEKSPARGSATSGRSDAGTGAASPYRSPLAADANAGRVALITGGGSGIGRAAAVEFARTGASIAICGRREDPLRTTQELLGPSGAACLARPTDVRDPDQVASLVDETLERFGRIDALVHCAGGQFMAPGRGHHDERLASRAPAHGRGGVEPDPNGRGSLDDPEPVRRRRLRRVQPAARDPGLRARVGGARGAGEPGVGPRDGMEPFRDPLAVRSAAGTIATEGLEAYAWTHRETWERRCRSAGCGSAGGGVGALIAFLASPGGGLRHRHDRRDRRRRGRVGRRRTTARGRVTPGATGHGSVSGSPSSRFDVNRSAASIASWVCASMP